MHECPFCGRGCDCDGEDTWNEAASLDCVHACDEDEDDAPSAAHLTAPITAVVYEYHGAAYNRPVGRGIALADDTQLEDNFPVGDFWIDVVVSTRPPAPPDADAAAGEGV